ncbi:ubiquitin-like domain-containing protein CIP73 [Zingiber officinale]|uniref:ubiquitin-like domain-containing protein CIP73 n=1 Tax=Zingiber officinale TaxID=94328 RepID=UPI001C4B2432|nr:ubiquitin-like domain-containing protein CIP73 [Zingiber officinale]
MGDEFFIEGVEYRNKANITNMLDNGLQSHHSFIPGGLPSPASFVEVLLSTIELLMMQVDGYISQFTGHLEDQASLTFTLMCGNLQNSTLKSGVLLQNLGSLLLELGCMTMALGERLADVVINVGPAVFISATGPNPVVIQPVPFYPGSNFTAYMAKSAKQDVTLVVPWLWKIDQELIYHSSLSFSSPAAVSIPLPDMVLPSSFDKMINLDKVEKLLTIGADANDQKIEADEAINLVE